MQHRNAQYDLLPRPRHHQLYHDLYQKSSEELFQYMSAQSTFLIESILTLTNQWRPYFESSQVKLVFLTPLQLSYSEGVPDPCQDEFNSVFCEASGIVRKCEFHFLLDNKEYYPVYCWKFHSALDHSESTFASQYARRAEEITELFRGVLRNMNPALCVGAINGEHAGMFIVSSERETNGIFVYTIVYSTTSCGATTMPIGLGLNMMLFETIHQYPPSQDTDTGNTCSIL